MRQQFHPVVVLPTSYQVADFTGEITSEYATPWVVGRYAEHRPAMYTQGLFGGSRTLHMGIDLGGPVGVAVHAFDAGHILHVGYNAQPGDYGHVIVSEHQYDGRALYALHGHLSRSSTVRWKPGQTFSKGDVLGWLGDIEDNGGWPPHVHFQLSWNRPNTCDMPGVVDPKEEQSARRLYPDPRMVLGNIYTD